MTTFFKIYRDLTIFERSLLKILFRPTKNTTFDPSQKSAKNRGRAVLGVYSGGFYTKTGIFEISPMSNGIFQRF